MHTVARWTASVVYCHLGPRAVEWVTASGLGDRLVAAFKGAARLAGLSHRPSSTTVAAAMCSGTDGLQQDRSVRQMQAGMVAGVKHSSA